MPHRPLKNFILPLSIVVLCLACAEEEFKDPAPCPPPPRNLLYDAFIDTCTLYSLDINIGEGRYLYSSLDSVLYFPWRMDSIQLMDSLRARDVGFMVDFTYDTNLVYKTNCSYVPQFRHYGTLVDVEVFTSLPFPGKLGPQEKANHFFKLGLTNWGSRFIFPEFVWHDINGGNAIPMNDDTRNYVELKRSGYSLKPLIGKLLLDLEERPSFPGPVAFEIQMHMVLEDSSFIWKLQTDTLFLHPG